MESESPVRNGRFIQTFLGKKFWPLDPRVEEVFIEDIAHALANQCRFAGHSNFHYSVAQHSVIVSQFTKSPLDGLLHDASEAYLVDIPRPIKKFLPQYLGLENQIMICISQKFNLNWPLSEDVHRIDNQLLWVEKEQVMKNVLQWTDDIPVEIIELKNLKIDRLSPVEAEKLFLDRYYELVRPKELDDFKNQAIKAIHRLKGFAASGPTDAHKYYQMGVSDAAETISLLSFEKK